MNAIQIPQRDHSTGRYLPIPHAFPGQQSGIYGIINQINGKIYIGSAVNLSKRWNQHRYDSKKGIKGTNIYFQRALAKSGDVFSYEVIEFVAPERLMEREQFWIDFFRSNRTDNGYNLRPKASSNVGFRMSDETKNKLSIALTGRKQSKETIAKRVAKLKGKFIGRYVPDSVRRKLSLALKGKRRRMSPEASAECYRKVGIAKSKPVLQMTLDGQPIREFKSIVDAEAFFGKRTNIHSACNGKRKKACGFRWRYLPK